MHIYRYIYIIKIYFVSYIFTVHSYHPYPPSQTPSLTDIRDADPAPDVLSPTANALLADLRAMLGCDVAPSTLSTWESNWQAWAVFADRESFPRLPAAQLHIALFLTKVYNDARAAGLSDAPVRAAAFAIAFGHTRAGHPSPLQGHMCKLILTVAQRTLHKPTKKSAPLTTPLLQQLYHVCRGNIQDRMIFTALALGFSGFLRWSDLDRVSIAQSKFLPTHAELFLVFSKTDQIQEGAWVPIARSNTIYCAVANLEALLREGDYNSGPLIRRARRTKNGWILLEQPLGYTSFLRHVRAALQRTGLSAAQAKQYGTHMMRRGGATAAAEAGVPDHLFQQHGRWKSVSAKDGYVESSLRDRLSVTRAIGV
jgi:hypothetical protein